MTKAVLAIVVVLVVSTTPHPVVVPQFVIQVWVGAVIQVTSHVDATVWDVEQLSFGLSGGCIRRAWLAADQGKKKTHASVIQLTHPACGREV